MIDQYITFFINHWLLSLLFIFTGIVIIFYEMIIRVTGIRRIDPQEAVQLMNHNNAVVFDIRSQDEIKQGHIVDAVHLVSTNLEEDLKKKIHDLNKPIIIVGNSDQAAIQIAKKALKQGFQSVQILSGGLGAWQTAGLPLIKD